MYLNFIKRRVILETKRKFATISNFTELRSDTNTLIVSYRHELSSTQIYPFYFYGEDLRSNYRIKFQEIDISRVKAQKCLQKNRAIRRIYVQHAFMMENHDLAGILEILKDKFPSANIAFMDWLAPLHIRYACHVDQFIDVYVKKQTFNNFADYNRNTIGDTNLSDYYARRFNIPDEPMHFSAPTGFEQKIRLWPNFYLSPQMVDLFLGNFPDQPSRTIDLHARIATQGVPWYQSMRGEAKDAIKALTKISVASEGRVRRHRFFNELRNSKIVFSPFGYGEICWRDYEAFATGALLLKPDISHLRTDIDVFSDGTTYASINWDLQDLEATVEYFIKNHQARLDIARNSFYKIQHRISSKQISREISEIN